MNEISVLPTSFISAPCPLSPQWMAREPMASSTGSSFAVELRRAAGHEQQGAVRCSEARAGHRRLEHGRTSSRERVRHAPDQRRRHGAALDVLKPRPSGGEDPVFREHDTLDSRRVRDADHDHLSLFRQFPRRRSARQSERCGAPRRAVPDRDRVAFASEIFCHARAHDAQASHSDAFQAEPPRASIELTPRNASGA